MDLSIVYSAHGGLQDGAGILYCSKKWLWWKYAYNLRFLSNVHAVYDGESAVHERVPKLSMRADPLYDVLHPADRQLLPEHEEQHAHGSQGQNIHTRCYWTGADRLLYWDFVGGARLLGLSDHPRLENQKENINQLDQTLIIESSSPTPTYHRRFLNLYQSLIATPHTLHSIAYPIFILSLLWYIYYMHIVNIHFIYIPRWTLFFIGANIEHKIYYFI